MLGDPQTWAGFDFQPWGDAMADLVPRPLHHGLKNGYFHKSRVWVNDTVKARCYLDHIFIF